MLILRKSFLSKMDLIFISEAFSTLVAFLRNGGIMHNLTTHVHYHARERLYSWNTVDVE
jgi:hypothetical protein